MQPNLVRELLERAVVEVNTLLKIHQLSLSDRRAGCDRLNLQTTSQLWKQPCQPAGHVWAQSGPDLPPNGTNTGFFRSDFSAFGAPTPNALKSDLKQPRICPFWAKFNIPV